VANPGAGNAPQPRRTLSPRRAEPGV